jgi:hypothetical protein
MYIKAKGIAIAPLLLISLLIVSLGYGFLGNSIFIYRTHSLAIISLIGLSLAGIFALAQGEGGLIAAFIAIAFFFWKGGINAGIVAAVTAIAFLWIGLRQNDLKINSGKAIAPLEMLGIAVTVILTLTITMAISSILSGAIAGIAVGAIAAAITTIGLQIKDAEIPRKSGLWLLAIALGFGLVVGLGYGVFTQSIVPII